MDSKSKINIYVFEKNNVNCLDEVTKDGIHIMTDISMDVICKTLIRNMLLEELPKIWNHLPVINTWSDVLDIAVIRGDNNYQMVGSRKPGNEAYELKNIINQNLLIITMAGILKKLMKILIIKKIFINYLVDLWK